MSDPSDWEPLPEAQRAAHPGEFVDLARRPVAAPAAVVPAPVPAPLPPPPKAPDPAAEQALAALKSKLAQAPRGRSLVAELCRREAKAARKQRAAGSAALAACGPVAVPPAGPAPATTSAPPLTVDFVPGIDGRDEREDEPWFQQLPAAEQDRLRKAWALRREQVVEDRPGQRRGRNRRFVAALLVFTGVWAAGTGAWWHATLGAGIVCGLCWRNVAPCRYRDPMIALCCLLVAFLVAWIASASDTMPPGSIFDAVLVVAFAALVGFDGEIRQTGGFDQA